MADPKPVIKILFEFSKEAVICVKDRLILDMNPTAQKLFKNVSPGYPATAILPEFVLNSESEDFVSALSIGGVMYTVVGRAIDDFKVYMLDPEKRMEQETLSSAMLYNIRQPIQNVRMISERLSILSEQYEDERFKENISTLEYDCSLLERMTRNAAVVDAAERGRLAFKTPAAVGDIMIKVTAMNLVSLFGELVESVASIAEGRGIEVRFESDKAKILVAGDSNLLEQMLLNLLSNSLMHVKAGGKVVVTLHELPKRGAILSVSDNGVGISAAELPDVFHKWKGERTLRSDMKSVGLGMSAANYIAALHRGTLMIESGEGKGTTVSVTLPENLDLMNNVMTPKPAYATNKLRPIMIQLSTWLKSSDFGPHIYD